jgi:hypothetical protein
MARRGGSKRGDSTAAETAQRPPRREPRATADRSAESDEQRERSKPSGPTAPAPPTQDGGRDSPSPVSGDRAETAGKTGVAAAGIGADPAGPGSPPPTPPSIPGTGKPEAAKRGRRVLAGLLLAILALVAGALLWSLWSVPVGSSQPFFVWQPTLPSSLGPLGLVAMAVGGGLVGASIFAWRAFRGRTVAAPPPNSTVGTLRGGDGDETGAGQRRRWIVAGLIIVSAALLLAEAVRVGPLRPVEAALILICGALTVVAALFAIDSLASGEGLRFDSHWGGLGGGMGGWRLSPGSTLVLLTLIFLAATFSAVRFFSPSGEGDSNAATTNAATTNAADNSVQARQDETAPANSEGASGNAANASQTPVSNSAAPGGG